MRRRTSGSSSAMIVRSTVSSLLASLSIIRLGSSGSGPSPPGMVRRSDGCGGFFSPRGIGYRSSGALIPPHQREKAAFRSRRSPPSHRTPTRHAPVNDPRRSDDAMSSSLRELREERGLDQTLQNLLRALTLNLELRARYRVFEFEATQDGHEDVAALFGRLRAAEGEQIASLMRGLHPRLGDVDVAAATE